MPVLPRPKAVKDMLAGLVDREVELRPADPPRAADLLRTAVAVYVDPGIKLVAVAGLELSLAATIGAAIAREPRGVATACVDDRRLSSRIAEHLTDACETFGTLLARPDDPPIRLYQLVLPGDLLAADVSGKLLSPGRRLDVDVTVVGYDTGRLSLSV